jgi:hypothetical protein
MFDKLPERVRKSLRLYTAEFRWNVFDSRVKANVGVLPIENPLQMRAKRVVPGHDMVLQGFNARAQGRKGFSLRLCASALNSSLLNGVLNPL